VWGGGWAAVGSSGLPCCVDAGRGAPGLLVRRPVPTPGSWASCAPPPRAPTPTAPPCTHPRRRPQVGEHAGCGPGNLPGSGFTYRPEYFMEARIGFVNMSWRDMEVPTLDKMMDIVQVGVPGGA
jgi:hypothetical protein